ncbi:MAG: MmgE/PrpD family protein [Betaproteobacteria bacterium]
MARDGGAAARFGAFAIEAAPPPEARARAAAAVLDTIGVAIAGSAEPAARIVQQVVAAESPGEGTILGTRVHASASGAALANGTAAHAHDFDDMCFVSLAHPSAPLVAAALAAAEQAHASGRALLDAYVVGFELEARLGRTMNPRHYQRGWHCTSTLGTVGAAAASARLLGLDTGAAGHAVAIGASSASGLKENFGTMVKPLHAGLAARNGVLAALLAGHGMTASALALDGPQGFLHAMDGEHPSLDAEAGDLGRRWEILDTGIAVKLYPSCAGTHPTLDAILDLRRREAFTAVDVESVDIRVDSITPTVLIYDRPATGLEAKFSLPFCVAAAIAAGRVGLDTFDVAGLGDPAVAALMPRVTMRADPALDGVAAPLTQARIAVRLLDGRTLTASASGARGYPELPASTDELRAKFIGCAQLAIPQPAAERLLASLEHLEQLRDVRDLFL